MGSLWAELLSAILAEIPSMETVAQWEQEWLTYRDLFEYAPDGYLVTDAQGLILRANRSGSTLLGGEVVGRSLAELVPAEAQAQFQRLLGQLQRGINVKTADISLLSLTGQVFAATLTVHTVRDADEKITGFRWWVQDTTERQQDEILLRRSHQQQEIRQAELQTKLAMLDRQMRLEREEHRRTAHSLARNEAKLRALLQYSTDIVYILEVDTKINYVSPALLHILGYPPEEVIGKKFGQFIHPDDLSRLQELLSRLVTTPALSMPIVLRHRHTNGDWVYMESVCNNLLHDNNVQGIVVNSRDITERRKAEAAILERELRLGTIAASMPGAFYRFKWAGDTGTEALIYISDGLVELAGIPPSQVLQQPKRLWEIIHPDDRDQVTATTEGAKERLATFRREFRIVTATGEVKWVQDIVRYYRDQDGNILADGVWIDITERGDAETELQRLHELLQAVILICPTAIDLVDMDYRVLLWNRAAERVFGWSVSEVLQRESPILNTQHINRTLAGEPLEAVEAQYPRKDGTLVDVSVSSTIVRDAEGEVIGVLRMMTDISDCLRAQNQLQKQELAFNLLAENVPYWVVRFDPKLRYLYVNRSLANAVGLTLSTFLGKTNRELGLPASLVEPWEEALQEVLHTGSTVEVPLVLTRAQVVHNYLAQIVPEWGRTEAIASLLCIVKPQSQEPAPSFQVGEATPYEPMSGATLLGFYVAGRRNFAGVDLRGIKLSHAFVDGINLSGALLNGADLSHSSLQNSNLRGADLRGANLRGTNLTGADYQGADFRGADTTGAIGLEI
ncbi:MAG: PAS domain S-box protein [Pseudanabaenaceae cyanobacterium]